MECPGFYSDSEKSGNFNINRSGTLLSLLYVKSNLVAFIERFETDRVDPGMMHEYIRTIFLLDEAITLTVIKPFNDSTSHSDTLLSKYFHGSKLQVATLDKWIFPSERNKPANKGEPS
jgi:hypothetical protein